MDIILYLSNGYPTMESSIQMAREYVDAGCRIIEVDFPSRDPYLESDLIKSRMAKALENCDDYDAYMEEILTIKRQNPHTKLLLLAYENTILEIGVDKYIRYFKDNGFEDLLLVGLSGNEVKQKIIDAGLRVSCYVQYQMLEEEIASAKDSNGFVYLQAKPTPGQGYVNPKYPTLKDCVEGLRASGIQRPINCGVGVHAPEDVRMVKEAGGDAAFVGSTILKLQEDIPAMKAKIREFAAQC